jgi:hypothetical protein
MPQAIERLFATPMTSPRLPAINCCPSATVVLFLSRIKSRPASYTKGHARPARVTPDSRPFKPTRRTQRIAALTFLANGGTVAAKLRIQ